jgi:hypothetical protein
VEANVCTAAPDWLRGVTVQLIVPPTANCTAAQLKESWAGWATTTVIATEPAPTPDVTVTGPVSLPER